MYNTCTRFLGAPESLLVVSIVSLIISSNVSKEGQDGGDDGSAYVSLTLLFQTFNDCKRQVIRKLFERTQEDEIVAETSANFEDDIVLATLSVLGRDINPTSASLG